MTLSEFNYEFNILYNNISSGAAPGLNNYEKSLLLTNALESIVKAYYSGDIKVLLPGFEEDEKKRRELSELVRTYSTTTTDPENIITNFNLSDRKINSKSIFFKIPDDTWFIIHEQSVTVIDPCTDAPRHLKITPVKHDYYNTQIDNPFRMPNKKWAWRLDLELDEHTGNKIVEILYLDLPIVSYYNRYIHKPAPIILVDLDTDPDLTGMGLTINGQSASSDNELVSLDKEILQLAVNIAILRYRENSLQNIKNF